MGIAPFLVALLAATAASAASVADAAAVSIDDAKDDSRPEVVGMSMLVPAAKIVKDVNLLGFSWSDCGGASAWMKIKSASLQPDPVKLSGKITMGFSAVVSHSFGDGPALTGSVKMEKKVFGAWIKLPCVDNVGSCDYSNLCTTPPPPKTCPPEFVKAGIPCKCPFAAGNYTLPGFTFTVDASKIPKFLESGSYKVSVNVNSGTNQVLCANVELSLD